MLTNGSLVNFFRGTHSKPDLQTTRMGKDIWNFFFYWYDSIYCLQGMCVSGQRGGAHRQGFSSSNEHLDDSDEPMMTEKCLQLQRLTPPTIGRCVWCKEADLWPCLIFHPSAGSLPVPGGHPRETTSVYVNNPHRLPGTEDLSYLGRWLMRALLSSPSVTEGDPSDITYTATNPPPSEDVIKQIPSVRVRFPWLTSVSAVSWSRLRVTLPCGSGLLRSTVMCKVRRRSPRSSSSSAARRTILLTRPLLGACAVAGAPTPPPPGAETPISGSAGDEEPQHHFGATSGITIAKKKKKKRRRREMDRSGGSQITWSRIDGLNGIQWIFFLKLCHKCGFVLF